MRIRKRPVLFPSSLSPLPLSDPHLINRSPVVVQLSDATSTAPKPSSAAVLHQQHAASAPPSSLDRRLPSDQPLPSIGMPSNGCDDPSGIGESGAHRQHNKQDPLDEGVRREESGEDSGEKGNHTRKGRTLGSETQAEVLPPLSPSPTTQDGRWHEGEKAIPLKKRRGNFEENNNAYAATHSKKMKAKMKTKMNKKCSTTRNEDSTEEEEEKVEETKLGVNVSKKRARGSALMEGSRCSRVNGRGWRCCQQTLVGYSLCEHHLGKGRLRSMTSVRSRSIASSAPKKVHHVPHPSSLEKQTESVAEPLGEDEKKPEIITKKRMKLGMVKARSISSLLGQTNTQIAAVAHENNGK
ncbi:hypothetical protein E2542_SST12387 [Spatholobus suberectus]|nr:hypothetical protein E2542_SST12387 [Spatholobus suberectus]